MEMTSEKNPAVTWGLPDPLQTWKLKNQTQGKGSFINDVRQFLTIIDPLPPLMSDFYLINVRFFGWF